ncbi:hypothetical protein Tco_0640790, partial [Tanacetum coccineum]
MDLNMLKFWEKHKSIIYKPHLEHIAAPPFCRGGGVSGSVDVVSVVVVKLEGASVDAVRALKN